MADKTGTEIIAREIAFWHGSHITGPTRSIASDHDYGSWGHSPEKYAEKHWREYIGAAEQMLARINRLVDLPSCPRCNGPTRLDGCYLMCDSCKMVVGGELPAVTLTT